MVAPNHLRERATALAAFLGRLDKQAYVSSAYITRNLVPGEFCSPYRLAAGVELDMPRVFTCDDDPRNLATKPHSPVAGGGLAGGCHPARRHAGGAGDSSGRSEVCRADRLVAIDARRLFPWDDVENLQTPGRAKLQGLYFAVSAYLRIAEASGFVPRAIMLHRQAPEGQRPTGPRHFAQQVLLGMTERLLDAHGRADAEPALQEPFLLGHGLNLALAIRNRSVMVVVSDFLDPLKQYESTLIQAAARHHVVLVDVASTLDRDFPVPGWLDMAAGFTRCREGARHLEQGTQEKCFDRNAIAAWNLDRPADRRRLEKLAHRLSCKLVTGRDLSYQECTMQALRTLAGIR